MVFVEKDMDSIQSMITIAQVSDCEDRLNSPENLTMHFPLQ